MKKTSCMILVFLFSFIGSMPVGASGFTGPSDHLLQIPSTKLLPEGYWLIDYYNFSFHNNYPKYGLSSYPMPFQDLNVTIGLNRSLMAGASILGGSDFVFHLKTVLSDPGTGSGRICLGVKNFSFSGNVFSGGVNYYPGNHDPAEKSMTGDPANASESTNIANSIYLVMEKDLSSLTASKNMGFDSLDLALGIGNRQFRGHGPISRNFGGLFGGITGRKNGRDWFAEFDGRDVNIGVRWKSAPGQYIEFSIQDLEQWLPRPKDELNGVSNWYTPYFGFRIYLDQHAVGAKAPVRLAAKQATSDRHAQTTSTSTKDENSRELAAITDLSGSKTGRIKRARSTEPGAEEFSAINLDFKKGRFKIAYRALIAFIRKYPAHTQMSRALLMLGEILQKYGKHTNAINAFNKIIREYSDPDLLLKARYFMALSQIRLGDVDEGTAVLKNLVESGAGQKMRSDILYQLGMALYRVKQYRDAFKWFTMGARLEGDKQAQSIFYTGYLLYLYKRYSQAADMFADFADKFPEHPNAEITRYYLGTIQLKLRRFRQAAETFKKLKSTSKHRKYALAAGFYEGYAYYAGKLYTDAVAVFEKFAEEFPEAPYASNAVYYAAAAYMQIRDYSNAGRLFRLIIRKNPQSKMAVKALKQKELIDYILARSLYSKGMHAQSAASFEKFYSSYPRSSRRFHAALYAGEAYVALKKFDKARRWFDIVAKNSRQSALASRAEIRSAQVLYQQGRYRHSINLFEDVARRFPDMAVQARSWSDKARSMLPADIRIKDRAAFSNAMKLYLAGELLPASQAFESFLTNYPESAKKAEAAYYMGEIYFKDREYESAIRNYRKTIKTGKSRYSALAMEKLGLIAMAKGNYDEADKYFTVLGKRYPAFASKASLRMSEVANARRKASATGKDPRRTLYNQGYALFGARKFNLAIAKFREYLEKYPDTVYEDNALYWMGECYYEQEKYRRAEQIFYQVTRNSIDRKDADAQFKAALCLYMQEEYEDALDAFGQYKRKYSSLARQSSGTVRARYESLATKAGTWIGKCEEKLDE